MFELCKHKRGNKGGKIKAGIKGENQLETNPNNCDIIATNTTYLEKNAQYPTYYYTNTPYFVTFEGRRTINFRKVQKMNYLEKAIFGLEMEGSNPCITTVRQMVRDNNWQNAITVVTDASSGVKWELNISPMANCLTAWNFLESLNQELNRINATVSVGCGLHVHISNKLIAENVTAEEFTRTSLDRWNTNSGAVLSLLEADTMPFVLVQDIFLYQTNQIEILSLLSFYDINASNTMIYGTSIWEGLDKYKEDVIDNTFFATSLKLNKKKYRNTYASIFSTDPNNLNYIVNDLVNFLSTKGLKVGSNDGIYDTKYDSDFSSAIISNEGYFKRKIFLNKYENGQIKEILSCPISII